MILIILLIDSFESLFFDFLSFYSCFHFNSKISGMLLMNINLQFLSCKWELKSNQTDLGYLVIHFLVDFVFLLIGQNVLDHKKKLITISLKQIKF